MNSSLTSQCSPVTPKAVPNRLAIHYNNTQVPYANDTSKATISSRQEKEKLGEAASLVTFPLLRLPPEIQTMIIEETMIPFTCDSLSFLLTCSAVYYSARHLPFKLPIFTFPLYYSSSLFACEVFLRRLLPWQLASIRRMNLGVTEADLAGFGTSRSWWDTCQALQDGMQHLRVKVSLSFMCVFEAAHDLWTVNAEWVVKGLLLFRGLKTLAMEVCGILVPEDGTLKEFEKGLQSLLTWCPDVSLRLAEKKTYYEMLQKREKKHG